MAIKTSSKMRKQRRVLEMTQQELADVTELTQTGISWIEKGNPPTIKSAILIANHLYSTVEELFGEENYPPTTPIASALKVARSTNTTVEALYGDIFLQ